MGRLYRFRFHRNGRIDYKARDEIIDYPISYPVEHDGRNNLMNIELRLQEAGDETPECTGYHRRYYDDQKIKRSWNTHRDIESKKRSSYSSDEHLSGCSDIEKTGLERKRNRKSYENQLRGHSDRVSNAAGVRQSSEKYLLKTGKRILPDTQDEETSCDNSKEDS